MYSRDAEKMISNVVEYLVFKRKQADIALAFRRGVYKQGGRGIPLTFHELDRRDKCRNAIMSLNGRKKGKTSPTAQSSTAF